MNIQDVLIITLASVVGLLYLLKIRSYDIYEKEPLLKLLIVMGLGGFISVFTSLFLYEFVQVNQTFTDAIFKVGLIEELSKYFALILLYRFIGRDFNEIVDGVIYITAISLGFASIESIIYAFRFDGQFSVLLVRFIYPTLGHISFSGYMGIAFYIHKKVHKNYSGVLLSIALAVFAHGFYDGVLFRQLPGLFFHIIFISLIVLQLRLLKTALGFSAFRQKLTLGLFQVSDKLDKKHCSHCEKLFENTAMHFWKIKGTVCSSCNQIYLEKENILHLLQYYRPLMNSRKYLKKLKSEDYLYFDQDKKIIYNPKTSSLSADFKILGTWLSTANRDERMRALKGLFPGMFLKYIGLHYLTDHN